jgi:hypothetical protein
MTDGMQICCLGMILLQRFDESKPLGLGLFLVQCDAFDLVFRRGRAFDHAAEIEVPQCKV